MSDTPGPEPLASLDDLGQTVYSRNVAYVLGDQIPSYKEYCPIARLSGYWHFDFVTGQQLRFVSDDGVTFQPADVLSNPGFLVLQIAGREPENTSILRRRRYTVRLNHCSLHVVCASITRFDGRRKILRYL